MKTAQIPSPALCRWPLIEPSRSTISNGAIKSDWHPVGFLVCIVTKVWEAVLSRVPVGYEDATGFHHGVAEAGDGMFDGCSNFGNGSV